MKLKSLILGSVAAAGLSTAGFAADLGVLTSLDVCDALGLSGLTISSDTNCLQISGGINYEFSFGNYRPATDVIVPFGGLVLKDIDAGVDGDLVNDYDSKVETWLKFVGTASSDFGPARAVILLRQRDYTRTTDAAVAVNGDAHPLRAQEAYVQIGDTTVISAGKKGSIFNKGDDEPFNFLGLFAASKEDTGVIASDELLKNDFVPATGGHVIQVETTVGEGLVAKVGLEKLDAKGTLVGVLDYSGSNITAHISAAYGGLLTGIVQDHSYLVHAGVTAAFDQFRVRAAGSIGGTEVGNNSFYNGLISAEGTFDLFKIAASAEVLSVETAGVRTTGYGVGGSIGVGVTEGVSINLGGRYFSDDLAANGDGYQVAVQLVADVTETIKLTGELGVYGRTAAAVPEFSDFYGAAGLDWAPGGGFTSSLKGEAHQNGAYKVTFKAAKSFE